MIKLRLILTNCSFFTVATSKMAIMSNVWLSICDQSCDRCEFTELQFSEANFSKMNQRNSVTVQMSKGNNPRLIFKLKRYKIMYKWSNKNSSMGNVHFLAIVNTQKCIWISVSPLIITVIKTCRWWETCQSSVVSFIKRTWRQFFNQQTCPSRST